MENKKKKEGAVNPKIIRVLIALAAAAVIWFYVNGSSANLIRREITDIPVALTGEDQLTEKGLCLEPRGVAFYVNLVLRGTEQNLKNINASTVSATADLSEINEAGSYSLNIVLQGLPNTIILEEMNPSAVSIEVQTYTQKVMDVKVVPCGVPAEGYTLKSVTTREQVTLYGTAEDLEAADYVEALTYISGLDADSVQDVMPAVYDKNGQPVEGISVMPKTVRVSITLNAPQKTE